MKANHVRKVRRELAVLTALTLLLVVPLLIWSYVLPYRYPKPWRTLKNNSNISSIAFSPTGTTVASTGKAIYFNDWRSGGLLRTSSLPPMAPTVPPSYNFPLSVAYNLDGKSLASGHMDATIRI